MRGVRMNLEDALKQYLVEKGIAETVTSARLEFALECGWDPTYGNGEFDLNHYISWSGVSTSNYPSVHMKRQEVDYHEMLQYLLSYGREENSDD